jgi:hypothetical protein
LYIPFDLQTRIEAAIIYTTFGQHNFLRRLQGDVRSWLDRTGTTCLSLLVELIATGGTQCSGVLQ